MMHKRKMLVWLGVLLMAWSCGNSSSGNNRESSSQPDEKETANQDNQRPIILFFGNSITAGYGVDLGQAFPNLIQQRLDSLEYNYKVVNAGLSGETTSGGLNRIEWVLRTVPDIFVLELGANDGLRGLDLDETRKNLKAIIDKVREVNPDVKIILAGMMVPPNMGGDYSDKFQAIFPALASEKDVMLIPFILDGVAGDPDLNLPDGIHPTPEGHELVAENVWRKLKPLLQKPENT